jgi:hypothetical protein
MHRTARICLLTLVIAPLLAGCREEGKSASSLVEGTTESIVDTSFQWGVVMNPNPSTTEMAADLGCNYVRFPIPWTRVEKILDTPGLRLEEITPGMVAKYAFDDPTKNWSGTDQRMQACVDRGLKPFVVLACGFTGKLPLLPSGAVFTPDFGKERYLAHLSLFAQAAALRYGPLVDYWQLENELNAAGLTVTWGWRSGEAWKDPGFRTQVLMTLRDAVKKNDPTALVAVNFHTILPNWPLDLIEWNGLIDVVGLDVYPNYLLGWPVLGEAVGLMVELARLVAPGKRVIILETGYPSRPTWQGFSEKRQAEYLEEAVSGALSAGADGFYWYSLESAEQPGNTGVNFPFTLIESVEGYFGLVKPDGTKKPAYETYRSIIAGD